MNEYIITLQHNDEDGRLGWSWTSIHTERLDYETLRQFTDVWQKEQNWTAVVPVFIWKVQ